MSPETALPLQPPSAYEANRDIVFMTLPLLALSTYFYGARPAVLCLTAAFTAMLCDHLVAWLRHRPCDKTENSSIPSALVLVLLLPATVHYYVVVVSVAVAILLGKHAFGGYGHYPFNPAAFGYAVAAVSWPGEVFLYPVPFTTMSVLDTGSATVMESVSHTLRAGGVPNVDTFDLILGNYAGPIGATSVLILVACAMYLWMRRDITLGIPFGFLLSCALVAFFLPACEHAGAGAALAVSGHPPALAQIRDALRRACFCGCVSGERAGDAPEKYPRAFCVRYDPGLYDNDVPLFRLV